MFPAMCTHYDIERKKQIRIESISNALNADVDANLKASGTLLYACLKALDNAMRRASGHQETNGYKMGQFSQKIVSEFSVCDFWGSSHAQQLPPFMERCAAAQDAILQNTLAHMHSQTICMIPRLMGTKPETQEQSDATFTTLSMQIGGGKVTYIADLSNKHPGVWAAYRAERKLQVSAQFCRLCVISLHTPAAKPSFLCIDIDTSCRF